LNFTSSINKAVNRQSAVDPAVRLALTRYRVVRIRSERLCFFLRFVPIIILNHLRFIVKHFLIIFFSILTFILGGTTIILTWNTAISAIRWTDNVVFATVLMVGISVLSIIAKVLSTVAYGIKEPHKIRMLNIPTCSCWLVYNFVAFSIAGVVNEIMTLCSVFIAEFRYAKTKKKSTCNKQADCDSSQSSTDLVE